MSLPDVVTRDEWLAARTALLTKEKELTRQRDALNAERRRMPMVKVEKDYVFTGPDGEASLLDLFEGRLQLILGHFMFDPDWEDGCPSCSAGADEMAEGLFEHLHARDTTLVQVSRAPIEKIEDYKARKGWTFPWYSSYGTDFNYDFDVTMDPAVKPPVYNFRPYEGEPGEMPGDELLPARGRRDLPHELDLRARRRDDRRLVLLPRPHGDGPPGGLGGAEGPRRGRARRAAGLHRPAR